MRFSCTTFKRRAMCELWASQVLGNTQLAEMLCLMARWIFSRRFKILTLSNNYPPRHPADPAFQCSEDLLPPGSICCHHHQHAGGDRPQLNRPASLAAELEKQSNLGLPREMGSRDAPRIQASPAYSVAAMIADDPNLAWIQWESNQHESTFAQSNRADWDAASISVPIVRYFLSSASGCPSGGTARVVKDWKQQNSLCLCC